MDGGAGSDLVGRRLWRSPGRSALTVYFDRGYGQDSAPSGSNIVFGESIRPADIQVYRSKGPNASNVVADLYLRIRDTGDTIIVRKATFDRDNFHGTAIFADGTIWDLGQVRNRIEVGVSQFAEILDGDVQRRYDRLRCGERHPTRTSRQRSTRRRRGDDILNGGAGNDTYLFRRGSGNDLYDPWHGDGTQQLPDLDTLQVSALPSEVTLSFGGILSATVLRINGTSDSFTLDWHAWGPGSPNRTQIRFSNGTVWSSAYIQSLAPRGDPATWGTSGDDIFTANSLSQKIEAFEGQLTR